jgi:plastocyanin domain-containing protein
VVNNDRKQQEYSQLGSALIVTLTGYSVWPAPVQLNEQGIQRATITMDSYSYDLKDLSVQAGKPVELTLHNVATFTPHTFVVDDPAAGFHVRAEVSAWDTQTVRFTPKHGGTVTFYCDKKLLFFKSHRERGQEGHLEIH